MRKVHLFSLALFVLAACGDGSSAPGASNPANANPAPGNTLPTSPPGEGVIGVPGIASWNALAPGERDAVKSFTSLYLHQSVGQDLQDGAEDIGFKFEYYGPNQRDIGGGLNGGLFNDVGPVDNGKPMEKMQVVRRVLGLLKGKLKMLSFSFGYADVRDEDLGPVEAEYQKLIGEIRMAGVRFVHVTPPLVFDVAENAPKMKMRSWMLDTFKDDVIFDLQDIESLNDGKRCEAGGVWRICQENRSTSSCPSKGQGIDGDGQGHLCSRKAAEFSKAFLYAIYKAGR